METIEEKIERAQLLLERLELKIRRLAEERDDKKELSLEHTN